ncbi:NAD(P)-dependent oxidoreductase [Phyllobacterium sp. SB3]|uniref:NAD(P)-dependent oxidoreductase n=1 Tax=Phyllobacterium sp. SB3 TaxID=3156073 RepID=UPI0032AE87B2
MTSAKPRLAYIGLGLMGGPMARRLLSLEYPMRVFDVDAGRMAGLVKAGAVQTFSPIACAKGADVILINLPSQSAIEAVVFGEDGLLGSLSTESVVVDFSTVSPDFCRRIAERATDKTGSQWIDAPVSGGPSAAADGTLTIMMGGTQQAVKALRSLFTDIARQVTHVGKTGTGSVAKMIAQLIVGSNYAVLAEAVRLAEASGMNAALLPECVKFGHADGVLMQQLYPRIAAHDFTPRAYARQLLKDLEMVQEEARVAGTATPMSGQATQLFRLLIAAGHGDMDGTGIYRLYEGVENHHENRGGAQ